MTGCGVSDCSACSGAAGGCTVPGETDPHYACSGSTCISTAGCGVSDCSGCSGGGRRTRRRRVLAASIPPALPAASPVGQCRTIQDFYVAACTVTKWLLVFGIIIAAGFFIWGGVKYITSGGDSSKQEDAKKILYGALIGVVFLILAVSIVRIIASFFGAQGFNFNLGTLTCS